MVIKPMVILKNTLTKLPKNRFGGIFVVFVLAVLLVIGILGFALHSNVSGLVNRTSGYSAVAIMDHTAFEVAGVVFGSLAETLKQSSDPNFQKLIRGPDKFTLRPTWPNTFSSAIAADLKLSINNVKVIAEKVGEIGNGWSWRDPLEKTFKLILSVEISAGRSHFHKFNRRYQFVKLGKITRLALPLLSKFTLFVKTPEVTDAGNRGYNCVENFIDGELGSTSPVRPLVLVNGSSPTRESFAAGGWVFLGGDRDIQLHLTSGNDPHNGEFFQFYSLTNIRRGPPVFTFNELPQTSPFQRGVIFIDSAIHATLSIRGTYFGFYLWDKEKDVSDMNRQGVLQAFFANSTSRTMASSFLHLCGNNSYPSPTMIIGKVYRVFAYYSGLIYNAVGEGSEDRFIDMLEAPAQLETPEGSLSFWAGVNVQRVFPGRKFARDRLELSPLEVSPQRLFQTPENYLKYCSSLVIEPYNKLYDYCFNDTSNLPPPERFPNDQKLPYLISGEKLLLKDAETQEKLFEGDIRQLVIDDVIRDRITFLTKNSEDFFNRFIKNQALNLEYKTVFVPGDLELPENLSVMQPGIIVVKGNIRLKGGLPRCDLGPITLVSVNGDIALGGVNQEIHAHLIALSGTIYPTNNTPVKIYGALATNVLRPLSSSGWNKGWPGGGIITYDERLDPTKANRDSYYRVHLSDYYDDFQIFRAE